MLRRTKKAIVNDMDTPARLRALLGPGEGERVLLHGYVGNHPGNMPLSLLLVTDSRLLWAPTDNRSGHYLPPRTIHFANVTAAGEDSDGVMRFGLANGTAPGTLDIFWRPEHRERLHAALLNGLKKSSPIFASLRCGIEKFRGLQGVPVAEWRACPLCGGAPAERCAHAFRCGGCPRYYSDAGFAPVVSTAPETYGRLDRVEPWSPTLQSQLGLEGRTLAWWMFPTDFPVADKVILDDELLEQMDQRI